RHMRREAQTARWRRRAPRGNWRPQRAARRRRRSGRRATRSLARARPSLRSTGAIVRKAERTMLAVPDEGQDFRDRRVFARERLPRWEPFGEDAGAVEQLVIEGAHRHQALAGELAPSHADDVEAFQHRILPVDETERDDVAAHAADAADHHLP